MAFDPRLRGSINPIIDTSEGMTQLDPLSGQRTLLDPQAAVNPIFEPSGPGGGAVMLDPLSGQLVPVPLPPVTSPPPFPQGFSPGAPSGFAPRASLPSFGGFRGVPSIPSPPPFSGFFAQGDPFRRGLQRPPFFGGQSQQPFFGQSAVGGFQPEFGSPEEEERRRAALAAMLPAFLANLIGQ